MQMSVKPRQIAYLGILLALTEVILALAGTISISSMSFAVFASLSVWVALMITTPAFAGAYLAAAVILGFFILPDRSVLFLFAAAGCYQIFLETAQPWLLMRCPIWLVWVIKLGLFNAVLIPFLILERSLILAPGEPSWLLPAFGIGMNILIVIFDSLYFSLKRKYEPRIRAFLNKGGGTRNG